MQPTNDTISEHIAKFKRKITMNRTQFWLSGPEFPFKEQRVFALIVQSAFRNNNIAPMPLSHKELLTEIISGENVPEPKGYAKADLLSDKPSYLLLNHENARELIKHGYFPRILVNIRDNSLEGELLNNDIQAIIHGYKSLNDVYYAEIDIAHYDDIPEAMNRIFEAIQEVQDA